MGPSDGQAPASSDQPDRDERERHETPTEQLDRTWADLIQELRVVQTGMQFLTGFLLTLPFQHSFSRLGDAQRALYLATVASSIAATGFLQAPASVHRALFRRHQRAETVLEGGPPTSRTSTSHPDGLGRFPAEDVRQKAVET